MKLRPPASTPADGCQFRLPPELAERQPRSGTAPNALSLLVMAIATIRLRLLVRIPVIGVLLLFSNLGTPRVHAGAATVLSWGSINLPFPITNAIAVSIKSGVSPGPNALALRADGTVVAWGNGQFGLPNPPDDLTNAVAIAAGAAHSLVLRSDGTVMCWGRNLYGESSPPLGLSNVIAVSTGFTHSLVLLADGTLRGWGDILPPSNLEHVVAIASGIDHSLALLADGTVVGWGSVNQWGQADVPPGLQGVVAIAAGRMHSLALKSDGTVVGWGNSFTAPVPEGLSNVVAIAAGMSHSLAIRADHHLVGWGLNGEWISLPSQYTNITAVAASDDSSLALTLQPLILEQPVAVSRGAGDAATLSVIAVGHEPLTFQWRQNGNDIAGGTNAALVLTNLQSRNVGEYVASISTSGGSILSEPAAVVVLPALPTIITQPEGQEVLAGGKTRLSVEVIGSEPMKYQWLLNGHALTGKTNSVLAVENASYGDVGTYQVVITNEAGSVPSTESRLNVHYPITIANSPAQLVVPAGTNWLFTVSAVGEPQLEYQWQFNGTNLAGATNASFVLVGIQPRDAGRYSVVVRNDYWSTTNQLYVLAVTESAPKVVQSPASQAFQASDTVVLNVSAYGSGPLTYQWWHDGAPVSGATQSELRLNPAKVEDAGSYFVIVSNRLGSDTSGPAVLTRGDPYPGLVDPPLLGFTEVTTNRFTAPTAIAHAGDRTGRLFIVEQGGRIRVLKNIEAPVEIFLDLNGRVRNGGEQGLLGLAFAPDFAVNGHLYVNYTRKLDGATVIARYRSAGPDHIAADPASEEILLVVPQPFPNHNGGHLAFGPDGYLYVGLGDGGETFRGDPYDNGQNMAALLGKLLRLDVEGDARPYGIPAGNPFVGRPDHAPEIWAAGLRNPWRFSFDRLTGDLYIADVGERRFEEINFQPAQSRGGENYGWRIKEGPVDYLVPPGFTNRSSLVDPVAWYAHSSYGGAVVGGYAYRGPNEPRMNGMYFYGDFVTSDLYGMRRVGGQWQSQWLTKGPQSCSTFGEDESGNLLAADYYRGRLYRVGDAGAAYAPVLVPDGGDFQQDQRITVSSPTPGTRMHYTVDGREPTALDPELRDGITLPVPGYTKLKIRSFRDNLLPSQVAEGSYSFTVAAPELNPATGFVTNGTPIAITSATDGAVIRYSLDGTEPSPDSPSYSGPVAIAANTTLKARAFKADYQASPIVANYFPLLPVSAPQIDPSPRAITNGTWITISCDTPGATIRYTLDGSPPSAASAVYTAPFAVSGESTIFAQAIRPDLADSEVISWFYPWLHVPAPVFSPAAGPVTNGTALTISVPLEGVVIRYTLDGSEPDESSPVATGNLTLEGNQTVKAIGSRDGYGPSPVESVTFDLEIPESTVVTTFAGTGTGGWLDGPRSVAQFNSPQGLCSDAAGNLYVADTGNHRVRRIATDGQVTTLAGSGTPGYLDGSGLTAQFNSPIGIGIDPAGNFVVADRGNRRIRRISPAGEVTTLAGTGAVGTDDGPPDSATFTLMAHVAMDRAGNCYVGAESVMRIVSTNGYVSSAPLSNSRLTYDPSPAVDSLGRLFVVSSFIFVEMIEPGGGETTFAGSGVGYADGPGRQAKFPQHILVNRAVVLDAQENLIMSDPTRIRRITRDGIVSTLAGSGAYGHMDGPGGTASFNNNAGLTVGAAGSVFVADAGNHCIREIAPDSKRVGLPDAWQLEHFGTLGVDPKGDPDGDGMANVAEFWAGTDPLDSASFLRIESRLVPQEEGVEIRWSSMSGIPYVLQYSEDLVLWNSLGETVAGDGSVLSRIDPLSGQSTVVRYYRIRIANLD